MANYKRITDVDMLAEASETTNVLVEENGSLKKVPASAVGGGNGNFLVIRCKMPAASPVSLESDPVNTYIPNMTFADFQELLISGDFSGMCLCQYIEDGSEFIFSHGYTINTYDMPNYISLYFEHGQSHSEIALCFNSDDTVTEMVLDS